MPRSTATPIAGTCDVAIPATILAMVILVTVALGAAPARQHHLRIDLLGHTGHHSGHVLECQAVAERDLDGVVDISSDSQHAQPVAFQDRAALFCVERKTIEIPGLVFF